MKRKISCLLTILMLIFNTFLCNSLEEKSSRILYPQVESRNAICMEVSSGKILFYKNPFDKVAVASTTKIMTACIALENSNLTKVVEVSKRAAMIGGSVMGLKLGQKITINELLYGLMLRSGNDAAIAIAEAVCGNVEDFVKLMNKKVEELGLTSTHFVTPHGLDNQEHYSSAYDLAMMTKYALLNSKFCEIISSRTMYIAGKSLTNTNPLLGSYRGVDGVKTGYTSMAGRCLVLSSLRNGVRVITVVLNASTSNKRREDATKIMNYVYDNFKWTEVVKKDDIVTKLLVQKGKKSFVDAVISEDVKALLSKKEMDTVVNNLELKKDLIAPVKMGETVGKITLTTSGEEAIPILLVANDEILAKTILDFFLENITILIKELI